MANQTIKIVAKNTAPAWQITAQRAGTIIDVSGCIVSLIIVKGNTVLNSGHQTCVLVIPTSGIVSYSPLSTDIPGPGSYKSDLLINYPNGTYERLYDQLIIKARKGAGQ